MSICLGACLFALVPAAALRATSTPDAAPAAATAAPAPAADDGKLPAFGMTLARGETGWVVREVIPEGNAYHAGVREGDSLLSIDGVTLGGATFEQVKARLMAPRADAVTLKVRRHSGGSQELRLKRPAPNAALLTEMRADEGGLIGRDADIPGPQSTGRGYVISQAALKVGDKFLDFTLPRLGGGEITLSDYRGKPLLLDFWATWCGPCRAAAPGLAAITKRFGEKIQIIGVSLDNKPGPAIQYAQDTGLTYPNALSRGWQDPVIREYGIDHTGIPFNILFDARGRVAAMDLHGQPLADALELLLRRE